MFSTSPRAYFKFAAMTYVRQHHFHKQKIYLGLPRIFSIDPAFISVKNGLFSSKQHRSTRRNNSLQPGYLMSLVTKTNHNTIGTIDVYVYIYPDGLPRRTDFHTTPAVVILPAPSTFAVRRECHITCFFIPCITFLLSKMMPLLIEVGLVKILLS